mmetsp:Transcript_4766/g.16769  ORF Transcript_4766/g.16769 Transcript_4766/m.16769 type:complete len:619 (-) Transcript_4766:1277-3133(-)
MESGCLVRALFDYEGTSEAELAFSFGEVFTFVEMDPRGWAKGEKDGVRGWFPLSFVEVVESEPVVTRRSRGMTVCAPNFSIPDNPCEELFGGTYTVEYASGDDGYGDGGYEDYEEEYEEEEPEEEEECAGDPLPPAPETDVDLCPPAEEEETEETSAAALSPSEYALPGPAPLPPPESDSEEALPELEEVPALPRPSMVASAGPELYRSAAAASGALPPRPPAKHSSLTQVPRLPAKHSSLAQPPRGLVRPEPGKRTSTDPVPSRPFRHSVALTSSPVPVRQKQRSGSNPQEVDGGSGGHSTSPLSSGPLVGGGESPGGRPASPLVAKRLAACFGGPPVDKKEVELYNKEEAERQKPTSEDCDASSILDKKEETTVNLNFFLQNRVNIHADANADSGKKKSRLLRLLGKKEKRMVFGVPLSDLKRDAADVCSVPYVVIQCCQYLEQKGLSTKGLFRVPGNQDRMQKLKGDFKSPTDLVDQSRFPDPHTVASVLKAFFQQLPEPLIPFEFFDEMLAISESEKKAKKKIQRYQETISKLPASHNIVLIYLLKFLHNVSLKSKVNQMHARNLGIVWGPTLLRPATKDPIVLMSCNTKCTDVVECWIECYYKIFEPNAKRKK